MNKIFLRDDYIDGRLYFTNNSNHITMNDKWGNGTIYYIRTKNFAAKAKFINTDIDVQTTKIFTLNDSDPAVIKTIDLGTVIYGNSRAIIDSFVSHCHANCDTKVKVSYQDEHMKSILSILLSLQTISYFVKKIGNSYSLDFKIERYDSDSGKWNNLGANLPSSSDREDDYGNVYEGRDTWLERLAKEMIDDVCHEEDLDGCLLPVLSVQKRSLTHWRVLSMECAGKKLSIYPDGGFMNGWMIYNAPDHPRRYYNLSQLTIDIEIDLVRNQEIKFDVTIEDC